MAKDTKEKPATTLGGVPVTLFGTFPAVGQTAPDFSLVDKDLQDVSLKSFAGKRKVLNIVPSLDTAVCATSARKFNEQAGKLPNTVVLLVTSDLPFASKRFCTAEGLANVAPLSMMRSRDFAKDYGVLLTDGPMAGICARAVVVVDEKDNIKINSNETRVAMKYLKKLMAVNPPEVYAWDDAGNNRWMISGKGSAIMNPPSRRAKTTTMYPRTVSRVMGCMPQSYHKNETTGENHPSFFS